MTQVKAWLPEEQRSKLTAEVDGIQLGYGEDEAVELDGDQLERLAASHPDVQSSAGTKSRSSEISATGDSDK